MIIFYRDRRRVNGVNFSHGQVEITPSRAIKYPGIWLDDNSSLGQHIKKKKERAERFLAAILILMPNVGWGAGCVKRDMLYGIIKLIVLYRAQV